MPYIKVNCPSCGGEIELDSSKNSGFCLYCGTRIQHEDNIQKIELINQPSIENLRTLSMSAYRDGDYKESLSYANRVLEIDKNDWLMVIYKGFARARITPIIENPVNSLIRSVQEGFSLAEKSEGVDLPQNKINTIREFTRFLDAMVKKVNLSKFSKYDSISVYDQYSNCFLNAISGFEYCLSFENDLTSQDIINIYGYILFLISELTIFKLIVNGPGVGISKDTRKILFDKYGLYSAKLTHLSPSAVIPKFNKRNIEGGRIK